ncbi:MAG: TlyA family RNA methyltransferase, partial [Spirochaetia bacterium]|nr:TlyA family RNA methyltransferase [Spirochaetia bacterium]
RASSSIELTAKTPYVSRGGLKLEKALSYFQVDPAGRIAIDVGSSTGGFTDCLLKKGAAKVYAVDSGTHQLHESLRNDPRVIVMENTNARYLDPAAFSQKPDLLVMDVSFISISKVLPALKVLVDEKAEGISLVKPQFEAGPEMVESRGLVTGLEKHARILNTLLAGLMDQGLSITGLIPSPIRGEKSGNIEYLMHFYFSKDISGRAKNVLPVDQLSLIVSGAVRSAHEEHKKK